MIDFPSFAFYTNEMATPGQLVHTVSDVLGVPIATVIQYDRQLAENGLRSVKGRGRGAARVTARDAAHLVIALMGAPPWVATIRSAAESCEKIRSLQSNHPDLSDPKKFRRFGLHQLSELPNRHLFVDAIAALIEGAGRGERLPERVPERDVVFNLRVQSRLLWAMIEVIDFDVRTKKAQKNMLVYNASHKNEKHSAEKGDLFIEVGLSYTTLAILGHLVS